MVILSLAFEGVRRIRFSINVVHFGTYIFISVNSAIYNICLCHINNVCNRVYINVFYSFLIAVVTCIPINIEQKIMDYYSAFTTSRIMEIN